MKRIIIVFLLIAGLNFAITARWANVIPDCFLTMTFSSVFVTAVLDTVLFKRGSSAQLIAFGFLLSLFQNFFTLFAMKYVAHVDIGFSMEDKIEGFFFMLCFAYFFGALLGIGKRFVIPKIVSAVTKKAA